VGGIDHTSVVALGVACSAGPEPGVDREPPLEAVQSRADLFVEITDQLRAALDGANPEPNPFRGDPSAEAAYARAYRSAFTYGALGVGGWSHVGGDAAFGRGWSDGLRSGFTVWVTLAEKYGYKW
jgi:hypothetical protein